MRFEAVEAYLVTLSRELRAHGSTVRMVEEARGHLVDAVERGMRQGLDETTAQVAAIAQFGSAESVAATYIAETYSAFDRLVLGAALLMGIAIAFVDSRSTWDDAGVTALSLIMAGAICGFAAPRRPWRWALAVGGWIAAFAVARSGSPAALTMLIVAMFSLAGAYAGAALRCARSRLSPHGNW